MNHIVLIAAIGLLSTTTVFAQTASAPQALASGTAVGGISGAYGSQNRRNACADILTEQHKDRAVQSD